MDRPSPGSVGRAISTLSPSGTVEIGGAHYVARADRWPIEAGTQVVVTGFDPAGLFVRKFIPSRDEPAKTPLTVDDLIRAEELRRSAESHRIEEDHRRQEEERRRQEDERWRETFPASRWVVVRGFLLWLFLTLVSPVPILLLGASAPLPRSTDPRGVFILLLFPLYASIKASVRLIQSAGWDYLYGPRPASGCSRGFFFILAWLLAWPVVLGLSAGVWFAVVSILHPGS